MEVTIRKFEREDIPKKVEWINNPANNRFLHYDLPIDVDRTTAWFEGNAGRVDRYDAVIVVDGIACGLIGLLQIDRVNRKAEYYITLGSDVYKGAGVSAAATRFLLSYAFSQLELNRVYLYTETENIPMQRLAEKVGFKKEGCVKDDIISHGRYVDRFIYGICKKDYLKEG